ncbi:potassium channel family protein [Streptomyces sp. NPDC085524]|uniref:potassium channel family protein n=1 Tax=unclassified Streptomyces TaxID=2593676 RepID=UPI0035DEC1CC
MSPPDDRHQGRAVIGHILRSTASIALLTLLYYLTPMDQGVGVDTLVVLVAGLAVFGLVVYRQVNAITRSEYPRLRAVEALATAVPLFLVLFAVVYFLIAQEYPATFSEPMDRTDALYFTVTVFATVGFGDITPVSESTRALVTFQMIADLVVVGLVARVLFGAVEVGLRRKGDEESGPPPE